MPELLDNGGRADFAAAALQAHFDETHFSPDTYGDEGSELMETEICDLLGNLMHLAKRAGLDFEAMLENGRHHFEEEEALEKHIREEEAAEQMRNSPVVEQVWAALSQDFKTFAEFRKNTDIPVAQVRQALVFLKEQGKAEMVRGKGWRRLTTPAEDRVLAALDSKECRYALDIEQAAEVDPQQLRTILLKLQADGLVDVEYGKGWRLVTVQ